MIVRRPEVPTIEAWDTKPLGEICGFQGGSQPPKKMFIHELKAGYVRLIQIRDFKTDKFTTYIPESNKNRLCEAEDILIGRYGASVGQIHTGLKGAYNVALMKTEPDPDLLSRQFFYRYLQSRLFQVPLRSVADRSAQNGFSKDDIAPFIVPVPPLPEQERIVAILDEAFEGIATATAHAERNLHNARELFQSVLQSTFQKKGEDWVETTLGEACKMYQPRTVSKKDLIEDGPYPVFGANGVIGRYDQFNHEDPQVLVTCRGATCGAVNVSDPYSWITGNAMVVRPLDSNLDLRFLEYALRGGVDLTPAITGAAQPQITRTNLNPIPFGYPRALDTQKIIVKNLDALAAETRRLESIYQRKLDALAELKQSLLQRAFSGEL